jgi:hypothetical protein
LEIDHMRLGGLREGIQSNRVSFPSPVPTFPRESRADIQWRLADLYFVRNWSCSQLSKRYAVTGSRTRQLLRNWVKRAVASGYLQEIPAAPAGLGAGRRASAGSV